MFGKRTSCSFISKKVILLPLFIFLFSVNVSSQSLDSSDAFVSEKNPIYKDEEILIKLKGNLKTDFEKELDNNFVILNASVKESIGSKIFGNLSTKVSIINAKQIFNEFGKDTKLPNASKDELKSIYKVTVKSPEKTNSFTLSQKIKTNPDVLWAEPNYIAKAYETIPNDPNFNQQWALRNSGLFGRVGIDIKAAKGWDFISSLSPEPTNILNSYILGKLNLNLTSSYLENNSQQFSVLNESLLRKLEVETGVWGSATYDIFSKIIDDRGYIISEGSTKIGPSGQKPGWISLNFPSGARLYPGRIYRVYLRSNVSWASVYWKYSKTDNKKNYKLYGSNVVLPYNTTIVAVVDTGIDSNHEDFRGRILPGKNFVDSNNPTNDTTDVYGHGTHVAGIIAANFNNNVGISGLTMENEREGKIKILPVKALGDNGYGSFESLSKALIYSAENGAKVINASWGAGIYSQLLKDTILYINNNYDTCVVAAAGNAKLDLDKNANNPGGYEEVITVGSSDYNDLLSIWPSGGGSNFGYKMDLVAPGSSIMSLYPENQYKIWNGTSMATPHVTGIYAVLKAIHPEWRRDKIKDIILLTADDLGETGKDKMFSFGRLNFQNAVRIDDSINLPKARINFPNNNDVLYNGKLNVSGFAYGGPLFKEYKISIRKENEEIWSEIYKTSKEAINIQPLITDKDINYYSGNWIYIKLETFLKDGVYPRYTADVKRVFATNTRGWSKVISPTILTSPAIGDINNDGFSEIFVSGGNYFPVDKEKMFLFNNQGIDIFGWPKIVDSYPQSFQPMIVSIDNQNEKRVILSASDQIYVIDKNGSIEYLWPNGSLVSYLRPVVSDINNDGKKEMIVINQLDYIGTTQILVYNFEDKDNNKVPDLMPGWQTTIFKSNFGYPTNPVVFDLNNDNQNEIIINAFNEEALITTFVFNSKGEQILGSPISYNDQEYLELFQPIVSDTDGDNTYEILTAINKKIHFVKIISNKLTYIPEKTLDLSPERIIAPLISADFNRDNKQDLLIQTDNYNGSEYYQKYLIKDFQNITLVEKRLFNNENFFYNNGEDGGLVVFDADGDGNLEVCYYIYYTDEGQKVGIVIDKISLSSKFSETIFSTYLPSGSVRSAIIVGDINRNGQYDLVVNTHREGTLNVIELPFSYKNAKIMPWSMFNHDPQNTRNFDYSENIISPTPTLSTTPTIVPTNTPTFLPTITIIPSATPTFFPSPTMTLMPTPILTPTNILTPTPTGKICPLSSFQELGNLTYSLNNKWIHYTSFIASSSGSVKKISVKAGNWGNAQRKISCKVTDNLGNNISLEKSSALFTSAMGAKFWDIDYYSAPFLVERGKEYRIYCKGPDSWNSIYWIYKDQNNVDSKAYRVYVCN